MNHSLRALVLRLGRWSCGLHGYSCGYSRGDTSRALRSQLEQTVLENPAMESREVIGAYQSESEPSKPRVAGSSRSEERRVGKEVRALRRPKHERKNSK